MAVTTLADVGAVGIRFEADIDAIQFVFETAAHVPEAVLEGIERDVDDVVGIETPAAPAPELTCSGSTPTTCSQVSFTLTYLPMAEP